MLACDFFVSVTVHFRMIYVFVLMEVVISIIATHGVKQRRRFAPLVFALAICHRQAKRWKQLASDQKSASGVTERRILRAGKP